MKELKYNILAEKVGEEWLQLILEGNYFYELRTRYLMYILRGDSHKNALMCAYDDVEPPEEKELTKEQKAFINMVIVFDSGNQVSDSLDEISEYL